MGRDTMKTRCRSCRFAATEARQYPCNKCKEIQKTSIVKDAVDFYSENKEEE